MKYLVIPIDFIPDKYLLPVLIAVQQFRDSRDLRISVQPKIIHFEQGNLPEQIIP